MAFKAITAITVLYLLASCAAQQNCSAVQCKLVPVREDVASEFQSKKTSKKTIRMIYLGLKIGNDSYQPLETDWWVWAANINQFMLSLSNDCDIFSLGFLKLQVGKMNVSLEDEPKGCLATLNPSCQNIVVAQALLRNVITTNVSGGLHFRKDVVCVTEFDEQLNFEENVLKSDAEYRCCNFVSQEEHNIVPKCELKVQESIWFKAFYVVLNLVTIVVSIYSPVLLFLLPDFIFNGQKELKKERIIEEKEMELEEQKNRAQQNGYEHIPSSQETVTEVNMTESGSENTMLTTARQSQTSTEPDNRESTDGSKINENEPNITQANQTETITETQVDKPSTSTSNEGEQEARDPEPNRTEANPQPESDSTLTVDDNDEEKRKTDEIPVDDASPFNISSALYTCKSAEVFRDYSTKLSFNIKLAFLWYCLMPIVIYIELALIYTLKDEYFYVSFLDGGLFLYFDIINSTDLMMFPIVSYLVIPFLIILFLRAKDLTETRTIKVKTCQFEVTNSFKNQVYIGDLVFKQFKINFEVVVLLITSLAGAPVTVYGATQNVFDKYVKTGIPRHWRALWVLLSLICSVLAVIFSVIATTIILTILLLRFTLIFVMGSPYGIIVVFFLKKFVKKLKNQRMIRLIIFTIIIIMSIGVFLITCVVNNPNIYMYMFNPVVYMICLVTYPFFLAIHSCRFVAKLFGYTIMGLIINAEITAPFVTFVGLITKYARDRYLNSQKKYQKIKEIISEEWQRQVEGLLDSKKKPKVRKDTIPKKIFWFVCDVSGVLPVKKEVCRMLGEMAIIFLTAFLALCVVFFASDSYKISPVASTIAVFVSGKMPLLLLRDVNNFNGWEKITRKRKIKEAVTRYIDISTPRTQVDVSVAVSSADDE